MTEKNLSVMDEGGQAARGYSEEDIYNFNVAVSELADEVDPTGNIYGEIDQLLKPLKDKYDNLVRENYRDVPEEINAFKPLINYLANHIQNLPRYGDVKTEGARTAVKQHLFNILDEGDNATYNALKQASDDMPTGIDLDNPAMIEANIKPIDTKIINSKGIKNNRSSILP